MKRYERAKKPKKCPKWQSVQIADILYGRPSSSEELWKKIDEGQIVLGGCLISYKNPEWQCVECGTKIYKKMKKMKKRKKGG